MTLKTYQNMKTIAKIIWKMSMKVTQSNAETGNMINSPEQTINWICSQCGTGIVGPRPDECEYCGGLLEALEKEPLMEIGARK